jgi:hydroxyethylthiazole kinase-like sugar kinase family protein
MLLEEGTISQDESKISVKSLKIAKKFQRPTVMDPKI